MQSFAIILKIIAIGKSFDFALSIATIPGQNDLRTK